MSWINNSLRVLFVTVIAVLWSFSGSALAAKEKKKQATRRIPPRKRASKSIPILPDKKPRKPGVWKRIKQGMGHLVPTPVRRSWKSAQSKWKETKELYDAMKKFAGWDEKTLRRKRIQYKKRMKLERWKNVDSQAEKRILASVHLLLWKRSCQSGSARACRKWLKVEPRKISAFVLLRDIEWHRKRWKRVLPLCAALSKHSPKVFDHQFCHAGALFALKRRTEALKIYQNLAKKYPEQGVLWLTLGRIEIEAKRWKQAEAFCQTAVKRMPKDLDANACLGLSLEKQQKLKPARKAYRQSCESGNIHSCQRVRDLRPKGLSGAWVWSKMNTRINAMRIARATRQNSCLIGLKRACRSEAAIMRERAKQLKLYLREREGEWLLRKSAQIAPFAPVTWKVLGEHLLKHKRWFEGCYAIQRSLRLDAQQPHLWERLGDCRERESRSILHRVREAYTKACALGKNRACLKVNFGKNQVR